MQSFQTSFTKCTLTLGVIYRALLATAAPCVVCVDPFPVDPYPWHGNHQVAANDIGCVHVTILTMAWAFQYKDAILSYPAGMGNLMLKER